MKKEVQAISEEPINSCLTLFDEQFSISKFSESLEKTEANSKSILDATRVAVQNVYDKQENDSHFVVEMSDEIKEALQKGEVKLDTGKNGEIYAQLRKANGSYSNKLSIKEELVVQGVTPEQLLFALQMEAISAKLSTIIEDVKELETKVVAVAQGQRNDRIGLFYSGLSLYLESKVMNNTTLREQMTTMALKTISDANSQMIQDIRTSVEYLISKKYGKGKDAPERISEHLSIIRQCYDVVYRASFLKATIYQENNEIGAMLTAIDEYSRFVKQMIEPYVGILSELDPNSQLISKSDWQKIADSLSGCRDLVQQLGDGSTYYLSMGGQTDGK